MVLNPGCACPLDYFSFADLVVVAEVSHDQFSHPSWDHPSYSYLRDVSRAHGDRVMLPQISRITPGHKMGVIVHGFGTNESDESRVKKMKLLAYDLVRTKRIGGVFLTNLEMGKDNVYGGWSCFWREFTAAVAELSLPN